MTLDEVAGKIAGLGIPGLILIIAVSASTLTGAAAVTSVLAALGPFGMGGGVITLGFVAVISDALTRFGLEKLLHAVLKQLAEDGHTRREILRTIEDYPISEGMKLKLKKHINRYFNGR